MSKPSKPQESENIKENKQVDLPSLKYWGDDAWRVKAACKGVDTNLFFPTKIRAENNGLGANVAVSKARLICAGCTVRKECLEFAFNNCITFGVFGGVPPRERRLNSLKVTDGSLSFKLVAKDLQAVRRHERGNHPQPFIEELSFIVKRSEEEVREMLASDTDTLLY